MTISYFVGACTGRSAGFLALEDAVDVASRLPILLEEDGTIRHQSAADGEEAFKVDRRQLMARRERDDQIAMSDRQRASGHYDAAAGGARECGDGPLDLCVVA